MLGAAARWSRVRAVLFLEAGQRKGDYRNRWEDFEITLLPLCPMGPTALDKYCKTAGPGLGLEE